MTGNADTDKLQSRRRPPIRALLLGACLAYASGTAADVRFEGLDQREESNARAFVQLADAPCDTPAWQRERLTVKAPAQIRAALEALGHYRSTVSTVAATTDEECWQTTFRVEAGPRTTLDQVAIAVTGEGGDDPVFRALVEASPLTPGAALDHSVYESFKRGLSTTAAERGYFEASFVRHEVVVDADGAHAQVDLEFKSGPRYRFGEVSFKGDFLSLRLLQKFNEIESGSYYDTKKLSATHKSLLDSGYFAYVNVNADPARAMARTVPVEIDLAPGKKRIYSGGLGFATDTGPRFRLNYRNRLINNRGHTLSSELLVSTVQSQIGLDYRIPLGDDRRDILSLSGGFKDEDTNTSSSQSVEFGVRYAHGRGRDWLETIFLDAALEDFEIGGEESRSRLIVPGINWWRLSASGKTQRVGRSLFFELRGTTQAIGSDTSYLQAIARAKQIIALGERGRLLARLDLGATAKDRLGDLPPSARFFAGGDKSVRGYSFESIGATNNAGEVIGGSNLITASLEVDWAINERWGIAVFADSGSAFNNADPDFSTGIGFGLRRQSPLGPVRIDVAHPLDLERKLRLHISFGPDL